VAQPGRSAPHRDTVTLSPFLLASILAALVSTAVLILVWYVDVTAPPQSGPTQQRANLVVAVGVTSVAWASVVFAFCRDTILRRMEELGEQLAERFSRTAAELAEQAEQTGVFRGMELETRRPRPSRPESTPGVVRYPRLAEAPAPDHT
jgi:hypothetical protein